MNQFEINDQSPISDHEEDDFSQEIVVKKANRMLQPAPEVQKKTSTSYLATDSEEEHPKQPSTIANKAEPIVEPAIQKQTISKVVA